MDSAILIDSTVLIDVERRHADAAAFLRPLVARGIATIHPVAALEVLSGARSKSELRTLKPFLTSFRHVHVKSADFTLALELLTQLHLSHSVGWPDCLIAATALRMNLAVATRNDKHFRAVKNLKVMVPY